MGKCSFTNCDLNKYLDFDHCILHCDKSSLITRTDNDHIQEFNFRFYEYAVRSLANYSSNNIAIPTAQNLLSEKTNLKSLAKATLICEDINFPACDLNRSNNFIDDIKIVGNIIFYNCTFLDENLDFSNSKIAFINCTFFNKWFIKNHQLTRNSSAALYTKCLFHKKTTNHSNSFDVPLFADCKFKDEINFENSTFDSLIFNDSIKEKETQKFQIGKLIIKNCTFNKRFILNDYEITNLLIENSEINDKLEFKYNKVSNFILINTNFKKIVDCFKTTFEIFEIKKCIFNEFVGFEDCTFGNLGNTSETKFIYATFLTFVNFRNATFNCGLDLKHINLKEPPNFLNALVVQANTNRETFRIIKHSFDRIGNIIEANRFYAYEMNKYKEELRDGKTIKDGIGLQLLRLYKWFSDYGQSIWRPFIWIIIFALTNMLINYGYENNLLYKICPNLSFLDSLARFSNEFAKSIIPFKNVLKPNLEFISLIFYIIFASLIWLIILAIKRRTKR